MTDKVRNDYIFQWECNTLGIKWESLLRFFVMINVDHQIPTMEVGKLLVNEKGNWEVYNDVKRSIIERFKFIDAKLVSSKVECWKEFI